MWRSVPKVGSKITWTMRSSPDQAPRRVVKRVESDVSSRRSGRSFAGDPEKVRDPDGESQEGPDQRQRRRRVEPSVDPDAQQGGHDEFETNRGNPGGPGHAHRKVRAGFIFRSGHAHSLETPAGVDGDTEPSARSKTLGEPRWTKGGSTAGTYLSRSTGRRQLPREGLRDFFHKVAEASRVPVAGDLRMSRYSTAWVSDDGHSGAYFY